MNPEAKLRREGLPEEAVAAFRALYDQLVAGASGTLPRGDVSFGRGVVAHVRVEVCADVPDHTTLSGVYRPAVETLR